VLLLGDVASDSGALPVIVFLYSANVVPIPALLVSPLLVFLELKCGIQTKSLRRSGVMVPRRETRCLNVLSSVKSKSRAEPWSPC